MRGFLQSDNQTFFNEWNKNKKQLSSLTRLNEKGNQFKYDKYNSLKGLTLNHTTFNLFIL